MASRYELSEGQWERTQGHASWSSGACWPYCGRQPPVRERGFVGASSPEPAGMIFRSGTASTRACQCAVHALGAVWRVGAHLRRPGGGQEESIPDDRSQPSYVCALQQAATGRKKGAPKTRLWGVSRGGLSTKVHLLADETGLPVAFRITAGRGRRIRPGNQLRLEGHRAEAVIADKGCDSTEIVTMIEALGAVAVIPPRRHWRQPRSYDRTLYKQRNLIERCFNRLKQFRRFRHPLLPKHRSRRASYSSGSRA